MRALRLDRLLDFFAGMELLVGLLWIGLAVLTVTLLVLMRTRWGQFRPLRKCVVLSLLAHLLLAGYATTVQIVAAMPESEEPVIDVSFVDVRPQQLAAEEAVPVEPEPWEEIPDEAVAEPEPAEPERPPQEDLPLPERRSRSDPADLAAEAPLEQLALAEPEQPEPEPAEPAAVTGQLSPAQSAEQIEAPAAQRREVPAASPPARPEPERPEVSEVPPSAPARPFDAGLPTSLLEQPVPLPRMASEPTTPEPADSLAGLTDELSQPARSAAAEVDHAIPQPDPEPEPPADSPVSEPDSSAISPEDGQAGGEDRADTPPAAPPAPAEQPDEPTAPPDEIYSLRTAPDRSRLAERRGATPESEEAVRAALKWLADNQEPDGRWDADRHGAGKELLVGGEDRRSAGIRADTGVTGLALLAFLASGHTHREGPYRETVRRGLQYLMIAQAGDGDLCGDATAFASMYCHAMATCALSEAYGMTGDDRLRRTVSRAIDYTIAAQDRSGGGFRYQPGDAGDTSQCGWQLMALKSAELAGIPTPVPTRNGIIRYLRSVSSGRHGGLASYRPNESVSRPMTAEALVCWQFLGMPREHPAGDEAGDYLLGELPGQRDVNLYYWYYATLAMYQLQGTHWQQWNEPLRTALLERQQKTGPLAGSWEPDTVWGAYGGRVYSTALATLCLEVYYRFLPLYEHAATTVARADSSVDSR